MSRLLFLSGWFPYPADNGSKLRIRNLLEGLASQHQVTLLSFADKPASELNIAAARAVCADVQIIPWRAYDPQNRRTGWGWLSPTPRSIVDTFSPAMEQRIRQTLAKERFDLVIASQLTAASYAPAFGDVPALFEEPEVGLLYDQFANAKSIGQRIRQGLTWAKHRRYVARILKYFRACTVVSEREREILLQCAPDYRAIEVIPNCIRLDDYRDIQCAVQPNTLIFTGSFRFFPNYEAMVWFLREVYPRVQVKIPTVRLTITGDHNNLPLPPAANVDLTGYIDNVCEKVVSSWASLAPLQQGGGTRLKILEAMALRTPVIATTKGAEGLAVQPNKHLLIADTPEGFAQQVIKLLQEFDLRQRLATNAYQLIRQKYDWSVTMPRFLDLVNRIIQ